MASTIAIAGGQTLTIPDTPTFSNVDYPLSGTGESIDLNDEGETVLGTVGPSTPFQLAGYDTPGLEAPLVVSAPPSPQSGEGVGGGVGFLPYALLALIAGVIAYGAYMLWKPTSTGLSRGIGKLETDL